MITALEASVATKVNIIKYEENILNNLNSDKFKQYVENEINHSVEQREFSEVFCQYDIDKAFQKESFTIEQELLLKFLKEWLTEFGYDVSCSEVHLKGVRVSWMKN